MNEPWEKRSSAAAAAAVAALGGLSDTEWRYAMELVRARRDADRTEALGRSNVVVAGCFKIPIVTSVWMEPLSSEAVELGVEGFGSLDDLMSYGSADFFEVVAVDGYAVVERRYVVRIPIADSEGEVDGEEIVIFPSREEAEKYVAGFKSEPEAGAEESE